MSIGQKAFDKVDPDCLFNTLRTLGFGEKFVSWIKCWETSPCTEGKSCMLTEPLLSQLRRCLPDFTFAQNSQEGVTLSGYADNVTISVASQVDVHVHTKLD